MSLLVLPLFVCKSVLSLCAIHHSYVLCPFQHGCYTLLLWNVYQIVLSERKGPLFCQFVMEYGGDQQFLVQTVRRRLIVCEYNYADLTMTVECLKQ